MLCGISMMAVVPRMESRNETLMPSSGQLADHEQAELVVGQVELGQAGQALVDLGQLAGGQASPGLDLHHEAAADSVGLISTGGGRENVVAFSTSSATRWITSFTAPPTTASCDSLATSTDVVSTSAIAARSALTPRALGRATPARCRAGQDDQAFRVAHAGGQVVGAE
jgi:hypothetical protein